MDGTDSRRTEVRWVEAREEAPVTKRARAFGGRGAKTRRGMGECAKNVFVSHAEVAVYNLRVRQSGTVVFARRQ